MKWGEIPLSINGARAESHAIMRDLSLRLLRSSKTICKDGPAATQIAGSPLKASFN